MLHTLLWIPCHICEKLANVHVDKQVSKLKNVLTEKMMLRYCADGIPDGKWPLTFNVGPVRRWSVTIPRSRTSDYPPVGTYRQPGKHLINDKWKQHSSSSTIKDDDYAKVSRQKRTVRADKNNRIPVSRISFGELTKTKGSWSWCHTSDTGLPRRQVSSFITVLSQWG